MKFVGHYGIAPDALMNSDRLSLADKAVFIALVHFANEEWQCWPSIPTLAKFACVSPRQVQKSIKHLQAEHWITGKRISNVKSCFYQLSEPDVGIQCIHDTEQQAIMRPKGTKLAATAIAASARSPMQPVLGTLAASATELNPYELPSVELKKREKERKAFFSQPKEQPAQNQDKKPSIDDLWRQQQTRPEPEPEQPGSEPKQTVRQEQVQVNQAPDKPSFDWTCSYVDHWNTGSEPTAWLRRRHPDRNIDSIIEQTEIQLQANGAPPIKCGLSFLDYCCEYPFETVSTGWETTAEFINQLWRHVHQAKRRIMKAAADCTYGEDGHFHLGAIARAWLDRRNLERFDLEKLIGDDEDNLKAAGPWEPIADPLGQILEYVEAYAKKFLAYKTEEAVKVLAKKKAAKLERRQKFEEQRDKRNQDGDT